MGSCAPGLCAGCGQLSQYFLRTSSGVSLSLPLSLSLLSLKSPSENKGLDLDFEKLVNHKTKLVTMQETIHTDEGLRLGVIFEID